MASLHSFSNSNEIATITFSSNPSLNTGGTSRATLSPSGITATTTSTKPTSIGLSKSRSTGIIPIVSSNHGVRKYHKSISNSSTVSNSSKGTATSSIVPSGKVITSTDNTNSSSNYSNDPGSKNSTRMPETGTMTEGPGHRNIFSQSTMTGPSRSLAVVPECLENAEEIKHCIRSRQYNKIKELRTSRGEALHDSDIDQLTRFVQSYYQDVHINVLRLCSNHLSSTASASLSRLIHSTSSTLRELDLSDNPLKSPGLAGLMDVLTATTTNTTTTSSTNSHTDSSAKLFASSRSFLSSEDESYNRNNTSDESDDGERSSERIGRDDDCDTTSDDETAVAEKPSLQSRYYRQLTRLNLSRTGIVGSQGGPLLASLIRNNGSIQELILSNNHLGTRGLKFLAPSFCYNNTLTRLHLSQTSLCDRSVGLLMDGLKTNKFIDGCLWESSLIELDLSCNRIGPIGAGRIAEALLHPNLRNLSSLNLSLNVLGPEGADHFAAVVRYSFTLTDLNLAQNNLRDGAIGIVDALTTKFNSSYDNNSHFYTGHHQTQGQQHIDAEETSCLRNLDLSYNLIKDDTCHYMAAMLRSNTSLVRLNIANNAIGDEGMAALAKALHDNSTLLELDISGNQMKDPMPFVRYICYQNSNGGRKLLSSSIIKSTNQNRTPTNNDTNGRPPVTLQVLKYENNNLSPSDEGRIWYAMNHFHRNLQTWLNPLLQQIYQQKSGSVRMRMLNLWLHEYHGDEEIVLIAESLRKRFIEHHTNDPPKLTHVFLGSPFVTDVGIRALASYMFDCNHVRHRNGTTKNNIALNCGIQGLYLKDCIYCTVEGMSFVSHALIRNPSLRCLSISNCNIDAEGAKLLYQSLQSKNSTLQRLTLDNNRIGDAGAVYIFKLVIQQQHQHQPYKRSYGSTSGVPTTSSPLALQSLNLSKNGLTDIAILSSFQTSPQHDLNNDSCVLQLLPSLNELYLHDNKFTDVSASVLAASIKKTKNCVAATTNNLSANTTTTSSSLIQLNISSNLLSTDGVQMLRSCFLDGPRRSTFIGDRQKLR